MNTATVTERKSNNTARKEKIINVIKKILLYTVVTVVGVFALVALYQIVKFLFVAANIDAVETAKSIGIRRERAANYNYSKKGTRNLYDAVDCAVTSMRNCEAPNENWKKELEKE